MNSSEEIRSQFPVLSRMVYGKPLVYFDNAATSQRPQSVLDLQAEICAYNNANIHRAVHKLSSETTDLYEAGREAVRRFIGASSREEVIFTSGTTASINLVASSFGWKYLKNGDRVIVSEAEHHSNIVSWQLACERAGAQLEYVPVKEDCTIDLELLEKMLDQRVRIVAVTEMSNVLGVLNPLKEIVRICHSYNIPVLFDGAQGIVHSSMSVKDVDCDFYAFSGHKIFAPTGIGILYAKKEIMEQLPPYMGGGEMVGTVSFEKTTYAELPLKFEAGTPNYVGGACFAPALDFAEKLRNSDFVKENEKKMMEVMDKGLSGIDGIIFPALKGIKRAPIYSFAIEGVHPADLALILDKMGIAVRSGLMCAEPLIRKYSDTGMLRASLMPYNTVDEVNYFIDCLHKAIKMLR